MCQKYLGKMHSLRHFPSLLYSSTLYLQALVDNVFVVAWFFLVFRLKTQKIKSAQNLYPVHHLSRGNNNILNLAKTPFRGCWQTLHCTRLDSQPCSFAALHSPSRLQEINQCYYVIWDPATRPADNGMLQCSYKQGEFMVLWCAAWNYI